MRKSLLLTLLIAFSLATNAGKVTEQEALKKAQQFMQNKYFLNKNLARGQQIDKYNSAFYVFNAENDGGFVIVSGDDRTESILGYSTEGQIDENMPPNLREWLEGYAREIENLPEDYQPSRISVKTRATMPAIAPLVQTEWNQGRPYNLMCPMDGENRSFTGCTATAQAQIMYYHKWPESSTSIPAYVTSEKKISLEALPATTFKWDKMKTKYDYNDTSEAADAVAELMRYCGQSDKMNYTSSGSGANIILSAMINHFSYSKNMKKVYRSNYSLDHWESIIYQELAEGRPVQYVGYTIDDGGGHAFVCDGYDGNGLYHLNWGWGGLDNGFFVLSVADPNSSGIDGKSSKNGYSESQHAYIGIKPGYKGEVEIPNIMASGLNFISQSYSRQSASENFENIELREYIAISFNIEPTSTYDIEVGWGLYQNDVLKKAYSSGVKTAEARTYSSVLNETSLSFGKDIKDGVYSLRQIYRIPGTSEWILCPGYMSYGLVADIKGTSMTIRAVDNGTISFEVNKISCSDYPQVGATVNVNANMTNKGTMKTITVCLWNQKKGASTWTRVGYSSISFGDGATTKDLTISYIPEEAGDYNLKLTSNCSDEALGTATISVSASEEVTLDGIKYSCSTSYRRAIIVGAISNQLPKDVIIPSKVSASGVECNVVSISNEVFRNMSNLRKVVVPEGVESIGMNAFRWCSSLQLIDLPSTITSLGNNLIYGSENLKAVVTHVKKPFEIADNVFGKVEWVDGESTVKPSGATLYVPKGTLSKYQAVSGWTHFAKIEEGEVKDVKVGDLNYRYSTGGSEASVIPGDYTELTDVTIPSSITIDNKKYTVSAIEASAFRYCNKMQSLTIEKGVKSIGNNAFYNCSSLKSVAIPEGVVSIGDYAFASCYPLQKLELPSTLTSIGTYVIRGCDNMSAVISRIQNPIDIPDMTFMTEKYIENQWTNIPSPATLYIPEGTLSKYQAINGWTQFAKIEEGELKEVKVGDLNYSYSTGSKKATVLPGDYAEIESITVPASIQVDGVDYAVTAIANGAFRMDWTGKISSVTLPNSIESIGNYAFYYVKFKQIQLPKKLKTIGSYAFCNCSQLKSLVIPKGVVSIGGDAFNNCSSMQILELPSTLTSLGDYLILYCDNLSAVISRIQNPQNISDDTFVTNEYDGEKWVEVPSPATLYVPEGTLSKYMNISGWTQFANIEEGELKDVKIGGLNYHCSTGTKTAKLVAGDYQDLESVNIPSTITVDGDAYSVTSIANEAFYSCSNLKSVILPVSLKSIGNSAFFYVRDLNKLYIPEGVESIGDYAFAYCYNLETLELPSTLTSIGNYIITSNNRMTAVYSHLTNPVNVGDNAFVTQSWNSDRQEYDITPSKATLYVPNGKLSSYKAITGWTQFANMEEYEAFKSIKIGNYGSGTYYCDYALDFSGTDEIQAYVVTGYDAAKKTVWLMRVKDVPANTPIMVKGAKGTTVPVPVKTSSSVYCKNMMVGNGTGSSMTVNSTDGDKTNYILSNGEFVQASGSTVGANKAYLQLPTTLPSVVTGSSQTVKLNKEKTTYCSSVDLDFSDVAGLQAYAASGYDNSNKTVWLTRVTRVPAGTGLLLKGTAGETYTIPSSGAQTYLENMLVGNCSGSPVTIGATDDDMRNYLLSDGKFVSIAAGKTSNLSSGKAYLQIPAEVLTRSLMGGDLAGLPYYDLSDDVEMISVPINTRGIGGDDDDTTGIDELRGDDADGVYYNLNGQRVENPGKGLFIKNGKKVIIR